MIDFQNKVVWITGASSGIGEALAMAFAQKGVKLILSARRESELLRVKENCSNSPEVMILPLDLSQSDTFGEKAKEVLNRFGQIDILVNNGGISQRSLAKDTQTEVDRQIMEVNFFGTIGLTKAVLPSMIAKKSGHLVVISSVVGKAGVPFRTSYSASKHALHGYFDALRAECWKENLKVLLVCPGFVKTEVSINALKGDGSKHSVMDDTTKRGLSPEKCASEILKAIQKDKQEVVISGMREKYGIIMKKYFPRLFAKIIRKAKVK